MYLTQLGSKMTRMKHEIHMWLGFKEGLSSVCALPPGVCGGWKRGGGGGGGLQSESWGNGLFFFFPFFLLSPPPGSDYSRKQTSNRKYQQRGAEIGQNVMRHKWKRKKEAEKKRGKKSLFLSKGALLKTTSNYGTFHICFTTGSFTLYRALDLILQG